MTTEQIINICETLLDGCDGSSEVMETIRYAMTDDRSLRNNGERNDPHARFGNAIGFVDSRVDPRHAHLVNWLHVIIVNMMDLEKRGLIQIK